MSVPLTGPFPSLVKIGCEEISKGPSGRRTIPLNMSDSLRQTRVPFLKRFFRKFFGTGVSLFVSRFNILEKTNCPDGSTNSIKLSLRLDKDSTFRFAEI